MSVHDELEEKERQEAIRLLREQMQVEGKLVGLYEKTHREIENRPVRHLLHMIELDSRKHIDICQTAIEILEGEDVLEDERRELLTGVREHVELEEGSIERANKILQNVWIRENKAVGELLKKLRDDERRHHDALKKLSEKTFFRLDPQDFTVIMRGTEFAEERYRRSREFWRKREEEST
jgi:rubrerythrin